MAKLKMEKSSGNVFKDLGFDREESLSLLIRSDLMLKLTDMIKRRGLTQNAAAKLLGVTQPRISDLTRGKIELFSIDTLVNMVSRIGGTVKISVMDSRRRVRSA